LLVAPCWNLLFDRGEHALSLQRSKPLPECLHTTPTHDWGTTQRLLRCRRSWRAPRCRSPWRARQRRRPRRPQAALDRPPATGTAVTRSSCASGWRPAGAVRLRRWHRSRRLPQQLRRWVGAAGQGRPAASAPA
jgi:hypothetical protein